MNEIVEIRQCDNVDCGLRYPLVRGHKFGLRCPVCLGSTTLVLARELVKEPEQAVFRAPIKIEGLLDNVRSAWNVGAIFRTADGFGVQKLHLCGITPTPELASVRKTAIGAEQTVPWEYSRNAVESVKSLIKQGTHVWALEQDERALPVSSKFIIDNHPIILMVGNEVSGLDPALLDLSERIVYIPMLGKKRSLNVEVAFGAAIAIIRNSGII